MKSFDKNIKVYIDDISNNQEPCKISFVNELNFLSIPTSVSYVPNCVLASENSAEDFESVPSPCECQGQCSMSCSCGLGSNIAYQNNVLCESFVSSIAKPIIECSSLCSCDATCPNRLVQYGVNIPLRVFMTESKGFGVQTLNFIPKLAFVCEYAGEIIDSSVALQRMKIRPVNDANYIYVLKEFNSDSECIQTIIDPTNIGNVGRYLNHSCFSNLIPVPIRAENMVPRMCFFARKDIMPMEELTYNYAEGIPSSVDIFKSDKNDILKTSEKVCHCRSPNCTGYLPFDRNWLNIEEEYT